MSEESKLAVSVDVEDWYHLPAVTAAPFSTYEDVDTFFEEWDEEYDYLTEPTHRTLDLFDELDITATFFVVGDIVENYSGLVEEIANRGHEIGCHGLHHACAIHPDTKEPLFSREEYTNRLQRARSLLEDASGQEVTGFRAPGAYIGGWMLDILEELKFEYDSSIARNSLYNKTDSELKGVGSSPYVPAVESLQPGGGREMLEFPWPYYEMPIGGIRIPAAGGPLIRLFGRRPVQAGIQQSLQRGHSIFYFHPIDIARESFPEVGNSKRRPGFWFRKGKPAETRIKEILTNIGIERITSHSTLMDNFKKDDSQVNSNMAKLYGGKVS